MDDNINYRNKYFKYKNILNIKIFGPIIILHDFFIILFNIKMNINIIKQKVKSYYKSKPYEFYNECYDYLENNFEQNMILKNNWEIKNYNDAFILESIRLYFLDFLIDLSNDINYFITVETQPIDTNIENTIMFIRKITLNDKQLKNLIAQLSANSNFSDNSSIFDLCDSIFNKNFNNEFTKKDSIPYGLDKKIDYFNYKNEKCNEIYLTIHNTKPFNKQVYLLNYQNLNMFCGVDYFRFIYYQNIDRFCEIYNNKSDKAAIAACDIFDTYYKIYNKLPLADRENIHIFSGVCLHALGCTYTSDIDLMIIAPDKDIKYIQYISKILKNVKEMDFTILLNDKKWHKINGNLTYQINWLTHELPQLAGGKDITDIYSNPKYHFNFLGMKFISVNMTMQKLYSRNVPPSYTDLLMLNRFNNYPIANNFCIPNMTISRGRITVYHDLALNNLYFNIKKLASMWYKQHLSIEYIKKKLIRCNESAFSIYSGSLVTSLDTSAIKRFHIALKNYYINKYAHGINMLLDVGSGHLKDMEFWIGNKIKSVVGIEPSSASIKKGIRRINKMKPFPYNFHINVIEGVGGKIWKDNKKYSQVYTNGKFNCITFMFTIHYMLDNINILLQNINEVIELNGIVIILLLDGDKINKDISMSKNSNIKIVYNDDPIFYIENVTNKQNHVTKNLDEIFVYFKGTYGMSKGSFEYLPNITELVNKFTQNNYKLIERSQLSNIDLPERNDVSITQLLVSSYYTSLIFKKY